MSQFTVVCPACRQAMACAEQHRGRNVKCPRCGAIVAVPAPGSSAVPSRKPPSPSIAARASAGNVPNREKMSPLTLATIVAVGLGTLFVLGLMTWMCITGGSSPNEGAQQVVSGEPVSPSRSTKENRPLHPRPPVDGSGATEKQAAEAAEANVVRMIEKLGGKVTRDESGEGKPVREVSLGGKFTEADFKDLAACRQLKSLYVAASMGTDDALKALAACSQLEELHFFAHTEMVEDRDQFGQTTYRLREYLDSKVTDAGLKELAACRQLRSLALGGCRGLTAAGLRELAACANSKNWTSHPSW